MRGRIPPITCPGGGSRMKVRFFAVATAWDRQRTPSDFPIMRGCTANYMSPCISAKTRFRLTQGRLSFLAMRAADGHRIRD